MSNLVGGPVLFSRYALVMTFVAQCFLATAAAAADQHTGADRRTNAQAAALTQFSKRIDEYVTLHKRLANAVGELDPTKSPAEISAREKALGDAIRKARTQARRGDLFTPDAARVLRRIVRDDFRRHPPASRPEAEDPRESESADFRPVINQTYPSSEPLETFPAELLRKLPPLPKELEYRMVGRSLILRDVEGNVILDFIPEVIA